MRIIGIDPGSLCGWALLDDLAVVVGGGPVQLVQSGTWDLSARRHEGGGMRYLRASRYFEALLTECGAPEHPTVVAYEEVRRHQGVDAAHVYAGIVGNLVRICEERGIPYRGIPVATVKKVATGKGNAKKEAMVAAADALWPGANPCVDDNEADARFIALALAKELQP